MLTTQTNHKVPYHDVDSMGIVWHGHYAKYFELARCDLLEKIHFGYEAMGASQWSWPVIDMHVRYAKPLLYNQQITIFATLKEWEYRLRIGYVIRDAHTGERLSKGHTVQVAVDRATQEMCLPLPTVVRDKLDELERSSG